MKITYSAIPNIQRDLNRVFISWAPHLIWQQNWMDLN